MKHRLAQQIEQINQFVLIFMASKAKCGKLIAKLDLDMDLIAEYDQIEKLFRIDLSILDLTHLRDRKTKLMNSIERLDKLESQLKIKLIKEQQRLSAEDNGIEYEYPIYKSQDININEQIPNNKQQEEIIIPSSPKVSSKKRISHKRKSAECQVKTSSRCGQLYNVWSKNRPQVNQSLDDKFDRLSKIIGILKKNAKEIYQEQKQRNDTLILQNCDEFNEIKQQLYSLKRQNINLKDMNTLLVTENTALKETNKLLDIPDANQGMDIQKQSTGSQTHNYEVQDSINAQGQSRATNVYNPQNDFSICGSRLYQKQTFQLQQSIIKKTLLTDSGVYEFRNQNIVSVDSDQEQISTSQQLGSFGVLTFNKRIVNEAQISKELGVKQLLNVGTKLKQIKQNRKRITNDDDIWSQMENMLL